MSGKKSERHKLPKQGLAPVPLRNGKDHLSKDDLDELQTVTGFSQHAAQRFNEIQAAFNEAQAVLLKNQGAQSYVEQRLCKKYKISGNDQIDLQTGAIRRGNSVQDESEAQ